jgi:hypothetical protein
MNDNLKDLLCVYLGELMCENESEFDWIKKDELLLKIRAANTLLDMEPTTEITFLEAVRNLKIQSK